MKNKEYDKAKEVVNAWLIDIDMENILMQVYLAGKRDGVKEKCIMVCSNCHRIIEEEAENIYKKKGK